jgi:4-hydroxyphenylacetate 3-monooxygenase
MVAVEGRILTPEDRIEDDRRPFTGEEFLESLRDGREIWIYGERVDDVTTHPAFRNTARTLARMYDALHDPKTRPVLTTDTDTGSGGYTHRFFRYARSREDLVAQRDAIAAWARMTYGWMGRSPDYKAALLNTLGANASFYGEWAANARAWYERSQNAVLFMNHTIVNPPVDRHKGADEIKDVYVTIDEETDAGIYVSGAKVVATGSALSHYNLVGQNLSAEIHDDDLATMFIAPMGTPGVKLICRPSYELATQTQGTPFDYPLSSRFDENDAIFILDHAFVPWENVLVHRDLERLMQFYPRSGFFNGYTFQGCTRLAVKLDFMCGLVHKALRAIGNDAYRGVQARLGEIVAWRNLFWAISDAMVGHPDPWVGDAVLPSQSAGSAYRVMASEAWPKVVAIVQEIVASGLIYLPSSSRDFAVPELEPLLKRYLRGSHGIGFEERVKTMKLLWDAVGSEFAGRHELYERTYAGHWEMVRYQTLHQAQASGALDEMVALAEQCMSEYDEGGWKLDGYVAPDHRAED